jgi:hypothetical protein
MLIYTGISEPHNSDIIVIPGKKYLSADSLITRSTLTPARKILTPARKMIDV